MSIPAFHVLVEQNRRAVYGFLMVAAGPDEADDCFQETFLAALRGYPRLRNGANLRAWILSIATRKAIDAARSRRRRPLPVPEVPEALDQAGEEPLRRVEGDGQLWRSVASLPERQRAALAHRYVLDLPYEEIGAAMGCSPAAARANVYQGLRKLRKEWER